MQFAKSEVADRPRKNAMPDELPKRDGLYRIETSNYVVGFVIERGRVTKAAPLFWKLNKRRAYNQAKWIAD